MRSLSAEAFGRAKDYLMTGGRPLEQARFKHLFEDGSLEEVAAALAAYQNPDGGYGHALEPDAFTPTSGALATSIGLRVLRETGATADHEQIRGAVGYLLATLTLKRRSGASFPPTPTTIRTRHGGPTRTAACARDSARMR